MKNNPTLPPIERLWRSTRALRSFITMDLMLMAGTERQQTINFCRALVRAGYAVRESVTRTQVRGRLPHYRLVKDPGPNLPVELIREDK
ncbi:MAG: hypothetical protein NTX59_08365 [Elusimicrobia bacterium]|nr:hypothetical protein [Elusimicrobiota bacterium]